MLRHTSIRFISQGGQTKSALSGTNKARTGKKRYPEFSESVHDYFCLIESSLRGGLQRLDPQNPNKKKLNGSQQ